MSIGIEIVVLVGVSIVFYYVGRAAEAVRQESYRAINEQSYAAGVESARKELLGSDRSGGPPSEEPSSDGEAIPSPPDANEIEW